MRTIQNKIYYFSNQKTNKFGGLKINLFYSLVGNLAYNGFKWIMLSVLSKMANIETVGTYSLGISIVAPVFTLVCLNLRTIQITDVENKHTFAEYFTIRLITIIFASLVTLGIVFTGGFDSTTRFVLIAFIGQYSIEMLADITNGYWQKKETMHIVSFSLALRGLIGFISFSLAFWASKNLLVSMFVYTICLFLVVYIYDIETMVKNKHKLITKMDFFSVKKIILLALPLTVVATANSYATNIPKLLIEAKLGREALGIFNAMATIGIIGSMVVNAAGYTFAPRYAKLLKQNQIEEFVGYVKKTQIYAVLLTALSVLIFGVFGKYILTLLYTREYAEFVDLLVLISIASGIGYISSLLGVGITAARVFNKQMWISVTICLLIFVLSSIIIPMYGLNGAGYVLIIANMLKWFIHVVFLRHILKIKKAEAF